MKMKKWKNGMALAASVSVMGMVLAGCGATPAKNTTNSTPTGTQTGKTVAGKPVEGGSITLDFPSQIKDLDPAMSYDTQSDEVVQQLYNQLVTYKGTTSEIVPMLAKSWTISPDGKTYTFTLRQDATFWNGDPVTAQSFIDEFDRVLSKKQGSPGESFMDPIVQGSTAYFKGQAKTVTGLSAPSKYTLVIKLNKPEPFFLQVLAMPFFSAVDQKFIDKVGTKNFDSTQAMGDGPFELGSINASQIVLKKNPNYWQKDKNGNKLPYLNNVTININTNTQLDAMHFEQGQTALMAMNTNGIPSSAFPHFKSDPTLSKTMIHDPANATYYMGLNMKIKPFNKLKVRQAFEYAIDKNKILQLINGRGQVANQPLPPGIKGYVNNLPADATYQFNPTKAKELLKEAGYPNGFTISLYSSNTPDQKKQDAAIQEMLKNVGITVNIKATSWATFLDKNEQGKTGFFALAWYQDFPDASDFLNTLFNTNEQPANNSTLYGNKQVDQWLNTAQTDTNSAQRLSLYKKATIQIMKDAVWVPLYYPVNYYAVQPWLHGYYFNPTLMDNFQYLWVSKH